jgi:bacterioferritin
MTAAVELAVDSTTQSNDLTSPHPHAGVPLNRMSSGTPASPVSGVGIADSATNLEKEHNVVHNRELLQGLNEQLNQEVSTALRYLVQAAIIKGSQWEPVRSMYEDEIGDEIGHARYLANQIAMLDTMPQLDLHLTPPPSDVRQMLERDAEAEREDVQRYIQLAHLAEEEGLMELKLRMEQQAADEAAHGMRMRRLLGEPSLAAV